MSGLNQDDIIRMAQDAGMTPISNVNTADLICTRESIERFANLVAAAEREACAKILDDMAAKDRLSNYFQVAAIAIRARGSDAT